MVCTLNSCNGEIFVPLTAVPEAHPASRMKGMSCFMGVKWPGHGIDQPFLSATKLQIIRAMPLPLLFTCMACYRVTIFMGNQMI
jgi:hypothetical protein